jgi:site-specific recombinase XerD
MNKIEKFTKKLDEDKKIQRLFAKYLNERFFVEEKSINTLESDYYAVKLIFEFKSDLPLCEINKDMILKFMKWWKLQKRKGKDSVTNSTVNTYYRRMSAFFGWLETNEHIDSNPIKKIDKPKVNNEKKEFLEKEKVEKILNSIQYNIEWKNNLLKTRNLAMFVVLLHTGVRRGELINIKLQDLDLDRKELKIRKEGAKNNSERPIPLNNKVKLTLKSYLNERRKIGTDTPYLWVSSTSYNRFTKSSLKQLVRKIKDESGVDFNLHQFRHTFAINAIKIGVSGMELKELLGHNSFDAVEMYLKQMPKEITREKLQKLKLESMV